MTRSVFNRRRPGLKQSTTVGRFYIVYLEYNPPVADVTNPNPTRWAMSYVDTSGTLRIGLNSYFDNVWSYAFGIAADPTIRLTFTIAAGSATKVTLLQGGNTINGSKAP